MQNAIMCRRRQIRKRRAKQTFVHMAMFGHAPVTAPCLPPTSGILFSSYVYFPLPIPWGFLFDPTPIAWGVPRGMMDNWNLMGSSPELSCRRDLDVLTSTMSNAFHQSNVVCSILTYPQPWPIASMNSIPDDSKIADKP